MAPDERLERLLRSLVAKVDLDLTARKRLVAEVISYAPTAPGNRPVVALIAVDLDRYYTSAESTFEALLRALDHGLPAGDDWHHAVLAQAARPGPGRPPLIRDETRARLDDLLRFRHFLRHAYAADLDWDKLRPLVASLPGTETALAADLAAFRAFLSACLAEQTGSH